MQFFYHQDLLVSPAAAVAISLERTSIEEERLASTDDNFAKSSEVKTTLAELTRVMERV